MRNTKRYELICQSQEQKEEITGILKHLRKDKEQPNGARILKASQELKGMKCCGNCKPLDIFDCEGCKYCDNGDSDNWIKR